MTSRFLPHLLCGLLSAGALMGVSAHAADRSQTPFVVEDAGTLMIRLRAIGVIPEDLSSATSIGGTVRTSSQAAPEVDLSYFLTRHLAVELIAASTRHALSAADTAIGTADVGSTYVLPPTLTLQYHPWPHARFSPYVGAGLTVAFFYDTRPAAPTIDRLSLRTTAGPAFQVGADYAIAGPWFLNIDAKQMILNTRASLDGGAIRARTSLDPTVIGAGIGYRF